MGRKLEHKIRNTDVKDKKTDSKPERTFGKYLRAGALGIALAVSPLILTGCDKPKKDETEQTDKKPDKAKECTPPECFDDGYGDGEWDFKYDKAANGLKNAIFDDDVEGVKEAAGRMKDIDSPIAYRANALEFASSVSNVEVVEALLEKGAKVNKNALWNAARIDANWTECKVVDDGVFELLLNNGGREIIQSDRKFGEMLLIETARYQEYEAVRLLAEMGVNVNAVNKKGETPLYFAMVDNRSKEIIELLKSKGAKEVIPHDKSSIDIGLAEAIFSNSTYMLKKLVDAGADVNRVLPNGNNVIENACLYGDSEMVSYLFDNGAVITEDALETAAVLSDNDKPDSIKRFEVVMKNGGAEIIMNGGGARALADAATEGDIMAVDMMLKAGASIEAIRSARWAVAETLNYIEYEAEYEEGKDCCKEWKKDLQKRLKILEEAEKQVGELKLTITEESLTEAAWRSDTQEGHNNFIFLLKNGGSEYIREDTSRGVGALVQAAGQGNYELVQMLIDLGVDVNAEDKNGYTALKIVRASKNYGVGEEHYLKTAKVLRKAGAE